MVCILNPDKDPIGSISLARNLRYCMSNNFQLHIVSNEYTRQIDAGWGHAPHTLLIMELKNVFFLDIILLLGHMLERVKKNIQPLICGLLLPP